MASPPSVNNATYDPKTDKKRKANSNDPGWKYGYWANLENRDQVTCILCEAVVCGGIKRLKQHLAGGYGDTRMCAKTTIALRKEMRTYLESNKRKRPLFFNDNEQQDDESDVVGVVNLESQGSESTKASKVMPSSGTAAKQRCAAFQYRPPTSSKSQAAPKEKKSVIDMLRKTPEEFVDERRSGCSQPTISVKMKSNKEREYVDQQWALWFYECGVPFNAAASRQFQIAVEATARFGPGYKPPNPYQLGQPMLKDAVKLTSTMREDHEHAWDYYGCTLMSDGWSDKRGRYLINFLVNSPEGTYFLGSVDASNEVQDACMLADLLQSRIDDIGREKVVQVITDNGANYKAAGRILMEKNPSLFWSPCAAHCLDLMLEDIGNLKEFKKPIARARRVTNFIYRHGRILSLMREKIGADLVRPAATRFATSFLTLKSLHKHRDALKGLFFSEEWTINKLAKTTAGGEVHDIVLSMELWNKVEDCLRASAPLLIVLRVVDGDEKPAMPEVAALMKHAKEKIKLSFAVERKKPLLKKIMEIIEKRWVKQMDHPLYGAALYLNPGKLHPLIRNKDDETIGQLRGCFLDVLGKMVQDKQTKAKINEQSMDYETLRGPAFSNSLAIESIEISSPNKCCYGAVFANNFSKYTSVLIANSLINLCTCQLLLVEWWRSYGGRAIELQRFARRIVSLCASSSGCERNWSTFDFIHTKKRNRLLHKRLNDIVCVSYNRKMKARFQKRREEKGKGYDPLVIEEFDWDNEWADSSYVYSEVLADVMALHGNLLMMLLAHQARCVDAIFQGQATTSMQVFHSWSKMMVQLMK